jgi:hypothetical protein
MIASVGNNTTINGQIIEQSLVITSALPQVIVAGVLYLILALAALSISFRQPGAPFTLAGILLMHSTLDALQLFSGKDDKKDSESSEKLDES